MPNVPQIELQRVRSHELLLKNNKNFNKNKTANIPEVYLSCPMMVLVAFQFILKKSKILGSAFWNPYTQTYEHFPKEPEDLTARHLQLLARNEYANTTGIMNVGLYHGLLSDNEIASIRCLVKATTLSGLVHAQAYGGVGEKNPKPIILEKPNKTIIIDQSGLQWQGDFRNTGGLFFYPKNIKDTQLPLNYTQWQNQMYFFMMRYPRPSECSKNRLTVNWHVTQDIGVRGYIDLDEVAKAIEIEFNQAFEAVVLQGDNVLLEGERINFKFLKAGMGFFASGIIEDVQQAEKLQQARLIGIKNALNIILDLPADKRNLGKIKRFELPYSNSSDPDTIEIIQDIEKITKQLGLIWGGTPEEDALMPRVGFVNATTNLGDPHAMPGNEGEHMSGDASIATNAPEVCYLRVGYNSNIKEVYTYSKGNIKPKVQSDDKPKPNKINHTNIITWGLIIVCGVISGLISAILGGLTVSSYLVAAELRIGLGVVIAAGAGWMLKKKLQKTNVLRAIPISVQDVQETATRAEIPPSHTVFRISQSQSVSNNINHAKTPIISDRKVKQITQKFKK